MSRPINKAVLLAAGRGTRMRDLTNELPKPMMVVRGKPILQHIIEGLRAAGVAQFLLVVGYRAEIVRQTFRDGAIFGVSINYETQVVQDGTGKVVELARDQIASFFGCRSSREVVFTSGATESIATAVFGAAARGGHQVLTAVEHSVLSYGDIIVDPINYPRLTTLDEDTAAIISVKRHEDVSKGGAVFVNERFELIDLREKPQPGEPTSPWYNAGIYAFRPGIFDFTARLQRSPRGEYELTDAIRALARSGKKVQALELSGDWADVRDPEILAQLNRR